MSVRLGAAAALAIGYLAIMAITGALPQHRQRVRFEPTGVMQIAPERVVRVELIRGAERAVFVRGAESGWTLNARDALAAPAAEKLSLAVQFMHTSGPARVLRPEELDGADARAFGLDRPSLSIALHSASGVVLHARFGGPNPDGMLQYMAVEGRPEVYLMSRFVGSQWLSVAESAFTGP